MAYTDTEFQSHIEQRGLPFQYDKPFSSVQQIAEFVANQENFDGGFRWWRDYALTGSRDPQSIVQQVRIVMAWDDARALLENGDSPTSVFERTNVFLRPILWRLKGWM